MIKQVMIGAVGMMLVTVGFYFLIPAWSASTNSLLNAFLPTMNAVYQARVQQQAIYLNTIVGYSFLVTGIGIWIWLLIFAWREEAVSRSVQGYYEEVA